MARCEDFPCCGHELGCCPDFEDGVQVNMKCVCGATVPIDSPSSLCDHCLNSEEWETVEESIKCRYCGTVDTPIYSPNGDLYCKGCEALLNDEPEDD